MFWLKQSTEKSGYVSERGQVVIRITDRQGSDHGERVVQMACSHCGHVYGTDTSCITSTGCPTCHSETWTMEYN